MNAFIEGNGIRITLQRCALLKTNLFQPCKNNPPSFISIYHHLSLDTYFIYINLKVYLVTNEIKRLKIDRHELPGSNFLFN